VVSVLFELSKSAAAGSNLQTLLGGVARAGAELVGAEQCAIMLLDDTRQYLFTKASHGLTGEEEKVTFRVGEGVAGWVVEHAATARVGDTSTDRRFKAQSAPGRPVQSILCVPLQSKDEVLGTLCVASSRAHAFRRDHEDLLTYLSTAVVKDIDNSRLYQLAITDPLTRAYNRQYLYQRLPNEVERSRRYGDPLSVIVFDVDQFKRLNDSFGHEAGDAVLCQLVQIAHATSREVDDLVRCGGEEFLLLLPRTDLHGAAEVAERLRSAVESAELPWNGRKLRITISLGVTTLTAEMEGEDQLLRRADELQYAAKAAGRNRVAVDALPTSAQAGAPPA
jgi:diguanylate cyclase (GGDEF)-like protein